MGTKALTPAFWMRSGRDCANSARYAPPPAAKVDISNAVIKPMPPRLTMFGTLVDAMASALGVGIFLIEAFASLADKKVSASDVGCADASVGFAISAVRFAESAGDVEDETSDFLSAIMC